MFLRRILLSVLVCVVALSGTGRSAFSAPEPYAIIASATGKVEVVHAGATRRASFGFTLERGDRVVVAPGASATVYLSDGNVIELAERSTVTIGGRVAPSSKVGPGAGLSGGVYSQVSRFVTGGSRQSGLVAMSAMRGGEERTPFLDGPRQTDLLTDRPTFAWRPVEGASRYRVSVSGDQGEVWRREVVANGLEYPADVPALARDADYLWKVEAIGARGPFRDESSVFHVLSEGAASSVRVDLSHIAESAGGANSPATHYLAGSYLSGRRLYLDASAHFEQLGRISPDSPAPHEALGNVYRAIGLMDQAAAEFQRALELTRQP